MPGEGKSFNKLLTVWVLFVNGTSVHKRAETLELHPSERNCALKSRNDLQNARRLAPITAFSILLFTET